MKKRSVVPGLILIVIGVLVLLSNLDIEWLNMQQLWPVVLMLLGVLGLVSTLTRHSADKGGIWFGVVGILAGAVFLYITVGQDQDWTLMSSLWPLFPAIAGLGWIVQWIFERQVVSDVALAIGSLVVAVVGYLYNRDTLPTGITSYWPLLLVLVGVGLIAQFLIQRKKS